MSHNIDLNVMNMRTDLAIDEVNNEELEKLKEEKENGIKAFTVDVTNKSNVTAKNVSIEASLPEELELVSKPENFDIEAGKTVTKTITVKLNSQMIIMMTINRVKPFQ